MNTINNLIELKELDNENIIKVLQERYKNNQIYTNINDILIAINPYKKINYETNKSYNSNNKTQYKDKNDFVERNSDTLIPHPNNIAIQCFNDLQKNNNNHSILVSGESGAGKTETTKIILKKLLNITKNKENNILLEQIYWSNHILESFGNAKTIRNYNSSRFGKFINIYYDNCNIVGARIDTYLLEKIRVTRKNIEERNFHIFYQLFPELTNYKYIQSNNPENPQIDNEENVNNIYYAFKYFDISENNIKEIKKILKVIIFFSNYFENREKIVELLNIDIEFLEKSIEGKTIKVGNEEIYKKLTKEEIQIKIDTFCQELYSTLFNYIVYTINSVLTKNVKNEVNLKIIGILDIFGFEILHENSIEQLCINYTNEILQNIFNKYFFEKEQQLYINEGLPFDFVKFDNNDDIIKTIENTVFKNINDVSSFIKPKDEQIMENLFKMKNNHLIINNLQKYKLLFNINHYAENVEYKLDGFIDKNKLNFPIELYNLLKKSNLPLLQEFIITYNKNTKLLTFFQKQILLLQNKIKKTKVNFIRCLKPNDEMKADLFCNERMTQQLKYNGVIEAIRVARQGYPIRIKNNVFQDLYGFLDNIGWVIKGKTLTFLKKEQEKELDASRDNYLYEKATLIQKYWKCFVQRKNYFLCREKLIILQKNIKMFIERKRFLKKLFIVYWLKQKFIFYKKKQCIKIIIKFLKKIIFIKQREIERKKREELEKERKKKEELERKKHEKEKEELENNLLQNEDFNINIERNKNRENHENQYNNCHIINSKENFLKKLSKKIIEKKYIYREKQKEYLFEKEKNEL